MLATKLITEVASDLFDKGKTSSLLLNFNSNYRKVKRIAKRNVKLKRCRNVGVFRLPFSCSPDSQRNQTDMEISNLEDEKSTYLSGKIKVKIQLNSKEQE